MGKHQIKYCYNFIILSVAIVFLAGCTEDKYDLSNLDATIGIVGDSLTLPGNNSTEEIYLSEFLSISNSNFITIEPNTYNYIIQAKSANNKIEFLNIPSFLNDRDAHINFYNPVINMTVYAQKSGEKISGTFVSADKSGTNIASETVSNITLKKGYNILSIREKAATVKGDTVVVIVPGLSSLTSSIPRSITFSTTSTAVNEFSFSTPLAFGTNASIVYDLPISGWNKTVKKLSLQTIEKDGQTVVNGYIKMTADIENKIPAYINIVAYGLDNNGDSISTDRLKVTVNKNIEASKDGKTAVNDSITILIQPTDKTVFKSLDGIDLRFTASTNNSNNESVTGIIINSKYQTFKASNIKVAVYEKLVGDFN